MFGAGGVLLLQRHEVAQLVLALFQFAADHRVGRKLYRLIALIVNQRLYVMRLRFSCDAVTSESRVRSFQVCLFFFYRIPIGQKQERRRNTGRDDSGGSSLPERRKYALRMHRVKVCRALCYAHVYHIFPS